MPLDGVKTTPDNPLLADQFKEPVEPEANDTVVVHVQPPLLTGQLVFALKLFALTVTIGGATQFHGTRSVFPLSVSVKERAVVVGQFMEESVTFTASA